MLELVDVHKSYVTGPVTTEVLRGVRLEAGRGEMLSIMGPSGSGKSTLMNIIGLLDRPTNGSVFLKGRELMKMSDDELSALRNVCIGFVFQSFFLLPRLTALENVSVPLVYRKWGGAAIRRRALEMLEKVGMGEHAHHKPNQLSGGQQQRVAIARALAGSPALLLADEPTGALDADTGRDIMALFLELNASEEATVIIITHDRDVARRCARRLRIQGGLLEEFTETDARGAHPSGKTS
ncbi:MAG: ABC transporter ATP-binding protein [Nitrospinae bacterium]|nr:ABC transporter ATP-binding protein [Nitrospinota bacterium]